MSSNHCHGTNPRLHSTWKGEDRKFLGPPRNPNNPGQDAFFQGLQGENQERMLEDESGWKRGGKRRSWKKSATNCTLLSSPTFSILLSNFSTPFGQLGQGCSWETMKWGRSMKQTVKLHETSTFDGSLMRKEKYQTCMYDNYISNHYQTSNSHAVWTYAHQTIKFRRPNAIKLPSNSVLSCATHQTGIKLAALIAVG